jgi:hypothetical protein
MASELFRTSAMNAAIAASLSQERLTKYLTDTRGNLDHAIALYERNTRLCESFYSSLQCMEVCFRNTLARNMAAAYGPDWLMSPGAGSALERDALESIEQAKRKVQKAHVRQGDVIAELSFGFWVGLLGPRYDATLWRQALYKGFRIGGPRRRVHSRFNALRRFRNRIAHHEPIFHLRLEEMHSEIINAIGWMCEDTSKWAERHSRFPNVMHGRAV